jgi:hypothetical protein
LGGSAQYVSRQIHLSTLEIQILLWSQVKAKKAYNSNCPGRNLLSGDEWYQLQAFRSVAIWYLQHLAAAS